MSDPRVLKAKDLHTPFNGPTLKKILAHMDPIVSKQAMAADLTDVFLVTRAGNLLAGIFVLDAAFQASEAMTVDVQVNGSSIMTGGTPQEVGDQAANSVTDLTLDPAKKALAVGDKVSIIRNWTTGGGVDTTPLNLVKLLWA